MTEASETQHSSPNTSAERIMGSEVISVLCDNIRDMAEGAIQDALIDAIMDIHSRESGLEGVSVHNVDASRQTINRHTTVNVVEHGPGPSKPAVAINPEQNSESTGSDPSYCGDDSAPAITEKPQGKDSSAPEEGPRDSVAKGKTSGRLPSKSQTHDAPSTRIEVVRAGPACDRTSSWGKQATAPSKECGQSNTKPSYVKQKRPAGERSSGPDIKIPCESGVLHSKGPSRNVQYAGGPSREKGRVTTEIILVPSRKADTDTLYQKVHPANPVYNVQRPVEAPFVSSAAPTGRSQTLPEAPRNDTVHSSLCDPDTYSNPSSFQRESSVKPKAKSTKPSKQDANPPPDQDDTAHKVISLPAAHKYNSPHLLVKPKLPKRRLSLENSSVSADEDHRPLTQSTPLQQVPSRTRPEAKEDLRKPVQKHRPAAQAPADISIDPGEVWPRYDAGYATYLKNIGHGLGPWSGDLDTTWDLSTINYSLYEDEPGQLPLNMVNPKYLPYTSGQMPPDAYLPGHIIPPPSQHTYPDYEYEEGECLPNGAIPDGYAVHYFKSGHYMGAGQAVNNYQAVNNAGVLYNCNNPRQPYLNGTLYWQQYEAYTAHNPFPQSAIECGKEHYLQQQYAKQQMCSASAQEQYAQYLQSIQGYAQESAAAMAPEYQQQYWMGHLEGQSVLQPLVQAPLSGDSPNQYQNQYLQSHYGTDPPR